MRFAVETLEIRRLLCALPGYNHSQVLGQPGYQLYDHVPATEFVQQHPELAGKDLWDAATFDPNNTSDTHQWLYDPHMIQDDRPVTITPMRSERATVTARKPQPASREPQIVTTALPDIVPIVGGEFSALQPYIDKTEIPGHNLMRFTTTVGNMGAGPIALTSSTSAIDAQGRQIVTQTVYKYDSVSQSFSQDYQREAGRFVFHPAHGHIHFEGYANYRLRHNVGGSPGAVVQRPDGSDAVGDKIGFCLINIANSFTIPGTFTSSSTLPGYNRPGQPSTGCGYQQGISVGRADVYDSVYDGQWIDVTGVPNGNYFLEVTMDASGAVQESNETNNTVFVNYTLNTTAGTGGVQADRFEPNNDFATATNLGESGMQTQAGLTIHITDEQDYYRFVAASSGTASVQLVIADRDVNLYLYDSSLNLLGSSTSSTSGTTTSPSTETVSYNFVAGQTYYIAAKGFGSGTGTSGVSSSYSVKINVKPTVDVQAPTNIASAAGGDGVIRIHRNGPVSSPLTVNLSYGGTAVAGVDYDALPASIIIGNEASDFDIPVHIRDGATLAADKTIIVSTSAGSTYAVGTANATVTLLENVKPIVIDETFNYAGNPQTVVFNFNEDIGASLARTDLALVNDDTEETVPADSVLWQWNALSQTGTATFEFTAMLANGDYTGTIAPGDVTDAAGNPLAEAALVDFNFLFGDLNGSGVIDFDDYVLIDIGYNTGLSGYGNGDLNRDGEVNFDDYVLIDIAFNEQ